MEVYPCPICGREMNRRGKPFTDPTATEAHITGAHDEPHKEERGEWHREQIEAVERDESEYQGSVTSGEERVSRAVSASDIMVPGPFLDEDDSLDEVMALIKEQLENPEAFGLVREDRVQALEDELEEHKRVIGELVETVEMLGAAVDPNDVEAGYEAWSEHGNDASTVRWDEDVYPFKEARYQ